MNKETILFDLQRIRDIWRQDKEAAYMSYENILRRYPEHPMVLREYGKALEMSFAFKDQEKACVLLERSLEYEPKAWLSWLYLGALYVSGYGKGYSAVVAFYSAFIQAFPDQIGACAEAYLRIGAAHILPEAEVSIEEALEAFRSASKLIPDRPEPYDCLAQAFYDVEDYQGAMNALEQSIRLSEQIGRSIQPTLKRLEDLKKGKPWRGGLYPIFSLAFHWPDEVLE